MKMSRKGMKWLVIVNSLYMVIGSLYGMIEVVYKENE